MISSLIGAIRGFGPVEGPPMLPTGYGPQIVAGANAFIATMGHLLGRARGRLASVHVDANVLEANLSMTDAGTVGVVRSAWFYPTTAYEVEFPRRDRAWGDRLLLLERDVSPVDEQAPEVVHLIATFAG